MIDKSSSVNEAAMVTTGTLRLKVVEDVAVANGSLANDNLDGYTQLYLGTGFSGGFWTAARSWLKFDLSHLPVELSVNRATINVHVEEEFHDIPTDEPIGIYYCNDDSWTLTGITWNNQPSFAETPSDVIDSPASPNMILPMHWYSLDVTNNVRDSLQSEDMILTEVVKQTIEVGTQDAFKFLSRSMTYTWNATYLEIEYTTPTTTDLSVDGITSGPLLEYINSPCPELGWTFSDPDYNDFQKDYDVELWNNTYYNDTMLWQAAHEAVSFIHVSGDPAGNFHPFGETGEFRLQMKVPSSELTRSGVVDKLYFTTNDVGDVQIENLEVSLLMVPNTAALTTDFNANYEGREPTIVLSRDIYEVSIIDDTIDVDVEDTFFLNEHLNLLIEIRLTNNTGDLVRLARTEAGPGSVATNWGDSEASTTTYTTARTYDLKIGILTQEVFKGDPIADTEFPFDTTVGYSGRFQIKYNKSYISRAGYLDKIYMRGDSLDDIIFENFRVTVVESPVLGQITNGTWVENYGGATPAVVLDESLYTVKNLGYCLVIDFDNTFYYSNTYDLLFDFQWDSLLSGAFRVLYDSPASSSYRAWDLHYSGDFRVGSGTAGYDLLIDFVNNEDSVPLEGCITLENGMWYYLRARTCDSFGIWSDWTTLQFKYEVISEIPSFTTPVAVPDHGTVGKNVTISLNVTHSLGIYEVSIEYDGMNHTMASVGDTYSYTWAPATAELLNYTIYMLSNGNTWTSVDGSVSIQPAGLLGEMTLFLIIGGAAVVIVVLVVAVMKKKPAKK